MLGHPTEYAEAVGALGQVVPKRPAGLSIRKRPITRSQTNLDMNVEESGPVRADEFDLQRVDEFSPTSADEYVVQEAEKLKHVLAPILPSKAEVESDNVSHLPFWFGALRVSMAEDFHLVIAKLTRRSCRTDTDCLCGLRVLLGNRKTEHMKHFQCSSCETARAKAFGVTLCRRRV